MQPRKSFVTDTYYAFGVKLGGYLLYGAGQLGVMALARFFFQWILHFAEPGTSAAPALFAAGVAGSLFLAFRVFDGVTDPIAGVASDAWVTRGHERRTLLWFAFLLPPLGMAMIFAPDASMSEVLRYALLALGMFVFFAGYTVYVIPYWSLVDDYSQGNVRTRARLSNMLGVGVLIATGFGFVISPFLIDSLGYFWAALWWGVPCAALMVLPYYAQPRSELPSQRTHARDMPLATGFKLALTHRRFLAVIVLFAGGQMSFTVMTAAAPYIATDLLGGSIRDVAALLGPFLGTSVLGFAIVPRLAFRFGWERSVLVATVLLGIAYGGAGLLGTALVGSPLTTAMCVFATAGPMASILLGLEGEAITGSAADQTAQVTSVYFGVYNFVVKLLNGVALFLTGLLAGAIPEHGPLAVRAMGFVAGGLLVTGVALYLVLRPRQRETPRLE